MEDIHNAKINTAGAFVCIHGVYPFMLGHIPHNDHIPIVRLGGHREEGETGWGCAMREVHEETGMSIQLITPSVTYLADGDDPETGLREIQWDHETDPENIPLLVVAYRREGKTLLSLMYLAEADQFPVPSSEVKGLLLLKPEEIQSVCSNTLTLEQYLNQEGQAILNAPFDKSLVLEPFIQLSMFSKILHKRPEIRICG